ncbi:MAG: peptide chain release factor 2 [Gemmatimonadetes bacterium]|nr:peptide chain release factor 2 [Gemmatimonadota bacterium]
MEPSEIKNELDACRNQLAYLGGAFDIENRQAETARLEGVTGEPDFWNNQARAQAISRQISDHKKIVDGWNDMDSQAEDLETLFEMAAEEDDRDAYEEIEDGVRSLRRLLETAMLQSMLSAPDDTKNAIVSIHPGAGGTESQDWAEMLMRMYLRWMESRDYSFDTLDLQPGEEAGIKSVSIEVSGEYAYGYLKAEAGVHRLVRISPFDSNHRRHTSFASVSVLPEIDDPGDIDLNEADLEIDVYRASGAGGQHVNKTSSAVRVTHRPSGIVVQCQSERSQHRNRESAMKVLMSRLYQQRQEAIREKRERLEGDKKEIAWGSQIRSYVFHPYTMVKDHRTGTEIGNIQSVMNGGIDTFIEAYLRHGDPAKST